MPLKLRIVYHVVPDSGALARRAAEYLVEKTEQIAKSRGQARIAISGGSTPKEAFALLADPAQPWRKRMPWDKLELFWVDERSVPPDHPDSNYRMTREALLDHVPLKPDQIHRILGELDPAEAAARYEADLKKSFQVDAAGLPRFDLLQLGIGRDGHTASLFPHSPALTETAHLATANHVAQMNTWRITLTWPVINQAQDVFFLVGGADKAPILNQVLAGPVDRERLPSQFIVPVSGILTLLLDQAAAALLPATDAEGRGLLERSL